LFFFSSRRRHTRCLSDWSSDVCSSDLAVLAGSKPGEQVVDLCAGAGGKTLALCAIMEDRGQIYATDLDKRRLAPIHARLSRAGRSEERRVVGESRWSNSLKTKQSLLHK